MAPHWKCGSGQPVAGSNPALSATPLAARTPDACVGASGPRSHCRCSGVARLTRASASPTIVHAARWPLRRLPDDEAWPGRSRAWSWAYAGAPSRRRAPVRHRVRLRQRRARRALPPAADRRSRDVARRAGIDARRDRRRRQLPPPCRPRRPELGASRHPDLRPAGRVGDRPHDRPHDPRMDRLRRVPATSRSTAITLVPTASDRRDAGSYARPPVARRPNRRRPVVLAGQACYTAGEWAGDRRRSKAGRRRPTSAPTTARSSASATSTGRGPVRPRPPRPGRRDRIGQPGYPSRAVLGGELAVPCTCNPLQQG